MVNDDPVQVGRSISGDIYLIAISISIFVVLAVTFLTRYGPGDGFCAMKARHL